MDIVRTPEAKVFPAWVCGSLFHVYGVPCAPPLRQLGWHCSCGFLRDISETSIRSSDQAGNTFVCETPGRWFMDFRWKIQYQFWVVCPFTGPLKLCLCKRTGKRSMCRHDYWHYLSFPSIRLHSYGQKHSVEPSSLVCESAMELHCQWAVWFCMQSSLPWKPVVGLTFWGV